MKIIMSLICMLGLYQSASAFTLRSAYKSNLCMDVNNGDPSSWRAGTNVEVWPCNGQQNQQFNLKPLGTGGNDRIYTFQALGKCLDVDMGFLEDWTNQSNIQVFSCNGGINQQFRLEPKSGGWFTLRSVMNGKCLDIDLNTANGWRYEHNVQLWNCSGESNQLWRFDALDTNDDDNDDIIILPTN